MSETPKTWQVIIHRQAEKVLQRLPKDILQRIRSAIRELSRELSREPSPEPRPEGCKKLAGYDNLYRIRVGEWRVSYAVEEDRLIILVLEISPRGGAYRNL